MGDVLRDEFIHWHQCDMLAISLEEMETMIAPIVEMLNRGYASDYKEGLYDTTKFYIDDFRTGPGVGQIHQWLYESCEIDTTAQIVTRSINSCADQILFENGAAIIPREFVGKPYFIFDMNGRVLSKGIAGKTIKMPQHTILKIDGEVRVKK